MTSAQVVETSVTNNSSFQNYTHPDDHTIRTTDTPGFKPFTIESILQRTVQKCTKNHNARKKPLFCSFNLLFSNVPTKVAVRTTPKKFEYETITDHFEFVLRYNVTSMFRKSSFSKGFLSTRKRNRCITGEIKLRL